MSSRVKAHQRYYLKDKTLVPGVTTVTSVLNKPALVKWSNNLGLKGIDVTKYVDDKARIGTLTHYFVECFVKGEEPDTDDYSKNEIEQANKCFNKFQNWISENTVEFKASELQLTSEIHRYGGTCDIYCILNNKPTLIDIKTSKDCYPEHYTQVSAYKQLLIENGYPVSDVRILRIGRDDQEGFDDKKVPDIDLHWERFEYCLKIYYINKKLKEG